MNLLPVVACAGVRRITVVEKSQDVIDMVEPQLAAFCGSLWEKVSVVHSDIDEWRPPRGTKFNVIYFDIWPSCGNDMEHKNKLHKKFLKHRHPLG
jgi:hypothetical protein